MLLGFCGRQYRVDCFAAGFEEGGGSLWVALGLIGRIHHDIVKGGEGLVSQFGVDRVLAGGVDGGDLVECALIGLGRCELVELGEGDVVGLADGDGRHRGVEQVFEQVRRELDGVGLWLLLLLHCAPLSAWWLGRWFVNAGIVLGGVGGSRGKLGSAWILRTGWVGTRHSL